MIRVSAVSYLNTKPFLHGLSLAPPENADVSVDIPSVCADKLLRGEADLGLVPVAVIPKLPSAHILPGFCIGANGPVKSVKLYSEVPLSEIEAVLCDYQSRTSVQLARLLARDFWKIAPEWKEAYPGYEQDIHGSTAGVVIGDRTFALNGKKDEAGKFPYAFDLAEEWKKMTGLPFVFACWVSVKPLPESFLSAFSNAMELGLQHIAEVARKEQPNYPEADVADYLEHCLDFRLGEKSRQGLELFLSKIR